jgi:hypothetical protein
MGLIVNSRHDAALKHFLASIRLGLPKPIDRRRFIDRTKTGLRRVANRPARILTRVRPARNAARCRGQLPRVLSEPIAHDESSRQRHQPASDRYSP